MFKTLNSLTRKEMNNLRAKNGVASAYKLNIFRKTLHILGENPKWTIFAVIIINLGVVSLIGMLDIKITENNIYNRVQDINLALLGTQAAIVGLVYAIAIALVTIVYQNNPARNLWVKTFNNETEVIFLTFLGILFIGLVSIQSFLMAIFIDKISLLSFLIISAFNLVYFVYNLCGTVFFLMQAANFLDKKKRNKLLKSYTVNHEWVKEIENDVRSDIWRNAGDSGLLPKGNEHVDINIGDCLFNCDGTICVDIDVDGGRQIKNIWFLPLRYVLNELLERETPSISTTAIDNRNNITIPLELNKTYPISQNINDPLVYLKIFSREATKPTVMDCLDTLTRIAFRFKKSDWHETEYSCVGILGDLANSIVDSIRQNQLTEFEFEIDNLIDYQIFLASLFQNHEKIYETVSEQYDIPRWFNYQPYGEIIRASFRQLLNNRGYVEKTASIPQRLLNRITSDLSITSINEIYAIYGGYLYELNRCWADDMHIIVQNSSSKIVKYHLNEPKRGIYLAAIKEYIGSWDMMIAIAFEKSQILTDDFIVSQRKLNILKLHLEHTFMNLFRCINSNYLEGAEWLVDDILRWTGNFSNYHENKLCTFNEQLGLINTSIFDNENSLNALLKKIKFFNISYETLDYKEKFNNILSYAITNQWVDLSLISILLLIDKQLKAENDQKMDCISISIANMILNLDIVDHTKLRIERNHLPINNGQFLPTAKDIFQSIIRIVESDEHHSENTYHANINKFIKKIKSSRGRDMIIGRGYFRSRFTEGLESLTTPLLILLLSKTPENEEYFEIVSENWHQEFTHQGGERVATFASLLLRQLKNKKLGEITGVLNHLVADNNPNYAVRVDKLILALDYVKISKSEEVRDKILEADIDQDKMISISKAISSEINNNISKYFPLSIFEKISESSNDEDFEGEITYSPFIYDKGNFTSPCLVQAASNQYEFLSEHMAEYVKERLLYDMLEPYLNDFIYEPKSEKCWQLINIHTKNMQKPCLVMARGSFHEWLNDWRDLWRESNGEALPDGLNFTFVRDAASDSYEGYIVMHNNKQLNVFVSDLASGRMFIFDSNDAKLLKFKKFDDTVSNIKTSFIESDEDKTKGHLQLKYAISYDKSPLNGFIIEMFKR